MNLYDSSFVQRALLMPEIVANPIFAFLLSPGPWGWKSSNFSGLILICFEVEREGAATWPKAPQPACGERENKCARLLAGRGTRHLFGARRLTDIELP